MKIYFDTSALVKRYKPETHSATVRKIISDKSQLLFMLDLLSIGEMRATLRRFSKESNFAFDPMWCQFLEDAKNRFIFVDLDHDIWNKMYDVVDATTCKTLDALHVAAALRVGEDTLFLTFDKQQSKAAQACGLKLLTADNYQI